MQHRKQGLFLSHAWAEEGGDSTFINRLQRDLKRNGYEAWLDARDMPSRGRSLPQEVTDQIDKADRLIAVVGPAWQKSEACQAERAYAIQRGKVLTPILRVGDYKELSPELTKFFVPDFRRNYESAIGDLLRVLASPVSEPGQLLGVPALPPHYQERSDVIQNLRRAVLAGKLDSSIANSEWHIVALQGMGGVGKSVLAAAYVRDYEVRRAFLDGVVWLRVGQKPNLLSLLQNAAAALGDNANAYTDLDRALQLMGSAFANKTCLLVLDDVWQLDSAEVFVNALGLKCRLLLTTRDASLAQGLGAELIAVPTLDDEAASKMLGESADIVGKPLPSELRAVAAACGKLPLALAQCGALVRGGTSWADLLDALQNADLSFIAGRLPNYGYDNVFRAIQASVDALAVVDGQAGERYRELAVFPPGTAIPETTIVMLWAAAGMRDRNARNLLTTLKSRSMMERVEGESPNRRFWLHDLYVDYVRVTQGDLLPLHERLLHAYRAQCTDGWHTGPNDGYFFEHLVLHMRAAGKTDELQCLLLDFDWLQARLETTSIAALLSELDAGSQHADVGLVRNAVRMSAHVLALDAAELAGQLIGRLQGEDSPALVAMLAQAKRWRSRPWLRPMTASLTDPRGPLIWTFAQNGDIKAVAVIASPAGTDWWAVSVTFDGQTTIWDLAKGEEVHGTLFDDVKINALAVTPDGNRMVFTSGMDSAKVWSRGRGEEPQTLEGAEASDLAITPDGKQVVCAWWETVTLWDIERAQKLWTIRVPNLADRSLAITPDGQQLLGGSGNALKVWDLGSGQEVWSLAGHSRDVRASAGIEQGERRLAVSAADDLTLKVWDLATGHEVRTLTGHHNIIFALAAGPYQDGNRRRIVSASGDGTLRVWDLDSGEVMWTLQGHSTLVYAVAVTPDGKRAVSGGYDRTLRVWDLENLKSSDQSQGFCSVSVMPDGWHAVFGRWDGTLAKWDLNSLQEVVAVSAPVGSVQQMAIGPDGKRLVCATRTASLGIWDLESEGFYFKAHNELIGALTLTPDGNQAVSCTYSGELKLWDVANGRELRAVQLNTKMACSLAATPDSKRMVLADLKGVRIFDFENWNEIMNLRSRFGDPRCVTITPDGKQVVTGLDKGPVVICDIGSGAEVLVLLGHTDSVVRVAVTADGRRLVSASSDRTVKLWDRATARLIATFTADGDIADVAITQDARMIVAVDALGRSHYLTVEE